MLASCRGAASLLTQTALRAVLPPAGMGSSLVLRAAPLARPHGGVCLALLFRPFSSLRFNRNLEFFSAGDKPVPKPHTKGSFCVSGSLPPGEERPVTVLMCWLMSRDSHVKKFVRFYNELGFDVLKVRISPFDLLRPTKGTQVVAAQLLEFLHENPRHSSVLVHGFSVGGYQFCESMVHVSNDMARHGPLLDRFVGQIWDSVVDFQGIPDGTSKAITNNKVLQASIKKYLEWFMRFQYDTATVHYERSSVMMHSCFLNRPGLFFLSKTDPVSTPAMVATVYEKWEKKGIPVFVKIFDKSPHVSHYHKHKEAYVDQVLSFLQRIGLLHGGKKRAAA